MALFSCFFVFLLIIVAVNAHSWVQCADYAEENGRDWDASKCRAYPRDYVNKFMYGGYVFGADVGMNHQPGETNVCQSSFSGNSYTSTYPSAKYNPGQRVCLAWPPKNHVSAKCSNPYIPDSGTKIYRSAVNPVGDPTLSQFRQNLVHDFGANTVAGAGVGYQNCPKFCTNNDKALCTGCFNIPSNLVVGKYTFMWAWSFNSVSDLYSTCFDIEIVANSGNNVTALPFVGPDDFMSSTTSSPSTSSASISTTSASSTTTSSSITTSSSSSSSSPSSSSGYGSTATSSSPSTTSSSSSSSSGPCSPSTTSRPSSTTHYSTTSSSCSCPDVCVNNTPCDIGSERCLCTKGGACDAGLTCASGICVDLATICV